MPNDKDSNTPPADPQSQSSLQSPVIPAAPPEGEVRADPNEVTNSDKGTAEELAREFRWVEIGQFAVNGALAIIGIIALCIYDGQLEQMKIATKAAKDAADTANSTLIKTEASAHLDQRAWLGIDSVNGPKPEKDKPLWVTISFKNTGRTPAKNVVLYGLPSILPKGAKLEVPEAEKIMQSTANRLGMLAPEMERTFDIPIYERKNLTDDNLAYLSKHMIVVHGLITFDDIFGEPHWITFCSYLSEDWSAHNFCSGHNDSD